MRRMNTVFLGFVAVAMLILVSCETPVEDTSAYDEYKADSLAQAITDSIVIVQYIEDNNIDESQVVDAGYGIKYVLTNPATATRVPALNDIMSLHMTYKFDDNQIYSTSDPVVAIEVDSLAWVERWNAEAGSGTPQSFNSDTLYIGSVPQDTVVNKDMPIETTLINLSNTKEPLDYTLYQENTLYAPQTVNFSENGTGLNFSWPFGLRWAIKDAQSDMMLNSNVLIMSPSQFAFGTAGSGAVPANSVVIFDVTLVNLRP